MHWIISATFGEFDETGTHCESAHKLVAAAFNLNLASIGTSKLLSAVPRQWEKIA